jgi:TonB-linked outer membrane protein, SusC/RagA family
MTKKTSIFLLLLLFLVGQQVYGQTGRISGTISDSNGNPVLGASVLVKGTTTGTISDTNGKFSINVPNDKATLVISYIGYEKQELKATKQPMNIVLVESSKTIDEVVVVGYGTQKKVNLTGAVSSVSMIELEGKPVVNIVEALQGTTPGLTIQQTNSQPGNRPSINIRGTNTLNNNDPLILIDGMIGDIQNVNPSDIQNISVLKDASSTAIYGSRASNGVILITTKKGSKDRVSVNYDFNYGVQGVTCLPKPVDSWIYAELRNEALVNSGKSIAFTPEQIKAFKEGGPNDKWINDVYKPSAPQQSHNISISGGTEKSSILFSVGYMNQNSMFVGPDYGLNRYNARLNVETQLTKRFKYGVNVAYARNEVKDNAYWTDWILEQVMRMPPIYPIKINGAYNYPSGSNGNSMARLEVGGYRRDSNDDLSGSFNGEFNITNELKLKGMVGGQLYNNRQHENRLAIPNSGDTENHIKEYFDRNQNMTSNLMLTYDKKFGDHTIGALIGTSYEGGMDASFQTLRKTADATYDILANYQSTNVDDQGWASDWSIYSAFARLNYNFKEKYLFEFNLRNDYSSKFAQGNRSGLFPSVSGAWRVSEEKFYKNLGNLPSLKVRSSWGLVGNNRIGDYAYMPSVSISSGAYSFNNKVVNTSSVSSVNTDIKWEKTSMFDVGADIGLLNNSLNFVFDYFHNMTYDILIGLPVPSTFGGGSPTQNAGKVKNAGWEASISYKFLTGKIQHSISANVFDSKNEVVDTKGVEWVNGYDINTIIKEGYPINSYYAYRSNGFFQNAAEVAAGPHLDGVTPKPGDIRYIDKNGDNVINADDRFVLGNPFPRYSFGLNYSFNYKGLDFSMFWQGVGQRSVWLRGESVEAFHNNNEGPAFDFHLDRWTPTNPNASYPRLTVGAESTNNAAKSDFWIQNGAYVRLKNIQLGYTIPSTLTKKVGVSRLRVYLSAENILTLSKMVGGWDPETTSTTGGRIYPVATVTSIGLNLTL